MKHDFFAGFMLLAACGSSGDPPPADGDPGDPGPTDGAPTIVVRTPNGGETFRGTAVDIAWRVTDDGGEVTYQIAALGSELLPIAQGTMASGAGSMSWQPPVVGEPTPLRIRIIVRDEVHQVTDDSDADFMVMPVEQPVGFATELQPILSQRCAGSQCHGGATPADGLRLEPGASYAALVGVANTQGCPQPRVAPGDPDGSYLMIKLRGGGDCFGGERMPRGQPPLPQAQLDRFAAWIADGALDN